MVYTTRAILLLVHDQSSYNVEYKRKPYKECHRLQVKKAQLAILITNSSWG